jgi:hypothetical protein
MRSMKRSIFSIVFTAFGAAQAIASGPANDLVSTPEDTRVVVDVLARHPAAAGKTVDLTLGPLHGEATVLADGRIDYLPEPDWFGEDAIIYEVCSADACEVGSVDLIVTPVNDAPYATLDRGTLLAGSSTLLDVLANDHDVDGDALTITKVTLPSAGQATLEDRLVALAVPADRDEAVSFDYTVCDTAGLCSDGVVHIAVNGSARAPTARDDSDAVDVRGSITIDVLTNDDDADGDSLVIVSVTQPANGKAHIVDNEIAFEAGADPGIQRMQYIACDIGGLCAEARVMVSVRIPVVNRPPIANDDHLDVVDGAPVTIDVLANDVDDADDLLRVTTVTQGAQGSAFINPAGLVRYDPHDAPRGSDVISYTVCDRWDVCDVGTLTVTFVAAASTFRAPAPVVDEDGGGCGAGGAGPLGLLALAFVAFAGRRRRV